MIEGLNFVRGAVSTKDLVPVLTAFHIYDGRVQGTDGRVIIDAPCEVKLTNITIDAVRFLKAVDACNEIPKLIITKGNKLSVRRDSFKALIPLSEHDSFPRGIPDELKKKQVKILSVLRVIKRFIGTDASRPWVCGVLIKDGYAVATNNIIIARMPIEWDHPEIVLPIFAIEELLRIGLDPVSVGFSDTTVTFGYENGSWLKTALFHNEWPISINDMLTGTAIPVIKNLSDGINKVLPFCPDPKYPVIKIKDNLIATLDGDMSASVGECVNEDAPEVVFRAEPLLLVLDVADYIDFSDYPKPCQWVGDGIQGVIVGVNL